MNKTWGGQILFSYMLYLQSTYFSFLSGNLPGFFRDEKFAQEIINILFCKIHDEMERAPEEQVKFRTGIDESKNIVKERIEELFKEVKETYDDVFEENDSIKLDDDAIVYIVCTSKVCH